jgi:hypothetical protein
MEADLFDLVSRDGKPITTIAEWRNGLNKREQGKFCPGRSAYETARAWTEPTRIPAEVGALLDQPPLAGYRLERAVVEATTRFDTYGTPRHHDILLTLRHEAANSVIVVGVEAKVNEDFARTLAEENARALGRGTKGGYTTKMPARLHDLSTALLGRDLPLGQPYATSDSTLRYQLLSALAGTLVEAHKCNATTAVVVVHEFQTSLSKTGIDKRSSERIKSLLERLGAPVVGDLPLGQMLGPYTVPGGGKIPADKPFYIAKVRTIVTAS